MFWSEEGKIKDDEYLIWLGRTPFRMVQLGPKNWKMIYREGIIADEVDERNLTEYIKTFVMESGLSAQGISYMIKTGMFTNKFYSFLKKGDLDRENELRDTKTKIRLFFKNGFLEIQKDGRTFYKYQEIQNMGNKWIWKTGKSDKDYTQYVDNEVGFFERVVENVTGHNAERKLQLMSAIGYLVSQHKDRGTAKAVIFYDSESSKYTCEGGTGKSFIAKALKYVRRYHEYDAKNFNWDDTFKFQEIKLDTNVLHFNDATSKRRFFENMFNLITDEFGIRKLNTPMISVPFTYSPKVVISTNGIIPSFGASFTRRMLEIVFDNYYHSKFTIKDEFGHTLFDDWLPGTELYKQWELFYSFIIRCCSAFLTFGAISRTCDSEDMNHKKFLTMFKDDDFAEMILNYKGYEVNKWLTRKEVLDGIMAYQISEYPGLEVPRTQEIWRGIRLYSDHKGWKMIEKKSGGVNMLKFLVVESGKPRNSDIDTAVGTVEMTANMEDPRALEAFADVPVINVPKVLDNEA